MRCKIIRKAVRFFLSLLFFVLFVPPLVHTQDENKNMTEYVSSAEQDVFRPRREQLLKPHTRDFCSSCCQWTTPVAIDTSTPNLEAQTYAALAVDDSGNLAVAWMETRSDPGDSNQIVLERSTNKGATWIRNVPYGYAYLRVVRDVAFDHGGNVWMLWTSSAGEFAPYYLNLSKSTNNGQSFTTVFTSREYGAPFFESKLALDRSNNVFMLWDDQQFKLTRFTAGNPSLRLDANIPNDTLRVDFWCSLALGSRNDVYAVWTGVRRVQPGDLRYYVFCSSSNDTGRTIVSTVRVDSTEAAQGFPACSVDTSGIVHIAYGRIVQASHLSIFATRSLSGGNNFLSPISIHELGSNTNAVSCIDELNGVDLLWSGDGGAYFSRSTDGGQTFTRPQLIVAGKPDLAADRFNNLFAIFETQLRIQFVRTNVLVDVKEEKHFPSAIELEPNFPNPFNPNTSFAFSIPSSSQVKLSIFDILGREVEQILNSRYAAGRYQASWTPRDISSGVYFYRLEVRDERERVSSVTRKLIYIR